MTDQARLSTTRPTRESANIKFRKEKGMGVRGKGKGKALYKGFPFPLPPAAGGVSIHLKIVQKADDLSADIVADGACGGEPLLQ